MDLVKVCPTCGTENPPTVARCGCGAVLIGVDLVERATTPQITPSAAGDSARTTAAPAQTAPAPNGPPVCAHADCGQINPPGATICAYCNRPLATETGVLPAAVTPAQARAPARRVLVSLPVRLAARFEMREAVRAAGGEADLFIVADRASGARAVLKLYRQGIEPRTDVLERVSKAAPDQLVRVLEYGHDEGVPYELLEYCEYGSLRSLLKGKPLPLDAARTMLRELTDAIVALHACGIVHRDLKPENVLIRGLLPLDLVLTDFGISSVTDATMHYTTAARTLRYSAPEAGSNWVGRASDYWALGMILVEALTGRHPFDGLSEAVIAHWLVTKPIDIGAVAEPRWQRLCRGLLTRDPKQRWGADQIERWMQGDDAVPVALEQDARASGEVAPYRVGDTECRTPRELAVALASNWTIGVKDLERGMLQAWLQNDLRDQNLARAAADAQEAIDQSPDERLLHLLRRLDPALPPVFKGYDVSVSGLAGLVRAAVEGENEARQVVVELLERRLLETFAVDALHEATTRFDRAKAEFEQAIATALEAGAPRSIEPQGREWQLRMLLFALEPPKDLQQSLRASALRVAGGAARFSAWYRALGDVEHATPARLAVMILLGPRAAQAGMELVREGARDTLRNLGRQLDAHPWLIAHHGMTRDRLQHTLETSHDEGEVLAAGGEVHALDVALARSVEELFEREVFETRPVRDAQRIREIRRRIGDWAAWRTGEAWRDFGDVIEVTWVADRRSYSVVLETQYETRRVAYDYGAADVARMPAPARETLNDVWRCRMPALPQFGVDLEPNGPQEVRCTRCGALGRAELQEAWGSTAYPFSTTFACNDKVGVQCQTRVRRCKENLGVPGAPAFIGEFIDTQARIDPTPQRTLSFEAARVVPSWVERIEPTVRARCQAMSVAADADVRADERLTQQRLRIHWSTVTQVRYRYRGRDYEIWIPERIDVTPVALEHPLPSPDSVAHADESAIGVTSGAGTDSPPAADERARGAPRWLRAAGWWLAVLTFLGWIANWVVNWKA